jgi:hypothetical protein
LAKTIAAVEGLSSVVLVPLAADEDGNSLKPKLKIASLIFGHKA